MTTKPLIIRAFWDEEAQVWVATSDDVPGLITEAHTYNILVEKLKVMVPELLSENGRLDAEVVRFTIKSESTSTADMRAVA